MLILQDFYSSYLLFLDFLIHTMYRETRSRMNRIRLPICGSANGETIFVSSFATARAARTTPMRPSPAIRPDVYRIPRSIEAFFSFSSPLQAFYDESYDTTCHDTSIQTEWKVHTYSKWKYRNLQDLNYVATNTPIKISDMEAQRCMIPSTSLFIIIACGAGISAEP